MFCKFQLYNIHFFFSKWRLKILKKIRKRLHPPPYSLTLTAYPIPGKVVSHFFIIKMTAKDVKRDDLYGLDHFL